MRGGGTFEESPTGFQPDFNITWAQAIKDYAHQIIELAVCLFIVLRTNTNGLF
jgi:hypothetical protein